MKTLRFSEVEIGGEFFFCGQAFHRIALETAEDAEGFCHLFLAETEVEVLEHSEAATEAVV